MQTEEFLRRILPPLDGDGYYCWTTPSGEGHRQRFVKDLDVMAAGIATLAEKKNTYYAMSSFNAKDSRKQANVQRVKSLWVDMDCGPGKDYPDQVTAAGTLIKACREVGIPDPMLVRSGNGVHGYWPLAEPLDIEHWKPLAFKLREALHEKVKADWQCTIDASRILRPINTLNFKDPQHPKPVVLWRDTADVEVKRLEKVLDKYEVTVPGEPLIRGPHMNSALDLPMEEFPPAIADHIANHCAQMALMRDSRGVVSEPLWRDCLSIIKFCEKPEEVAIAWSNGHPGFSKSETLGKMRQRPQPARCSTFDRNNPGICDKCEFKGELINPLRLMEVDDTPPEPVEPEPPAQLQIKGEPEPVAVAAVIPNEFNLPDELATTYIFRDGQMCIRGGETKPRNPFMQQFVVIDSLVVIDGASHCRCRARFADGTSKSFVIPSEALSAKDKCVTALLKHSILPLFNKAAEMHAYLGRWFQHVSQSAREMKQLQHFGWQPDSSFLIGSTIIKPDGEVKQASVSGDIAQYVNALTPQGDVMKWRSALMDLYGYEGMEQYWFILGVGFGAPLMKLTQKHGVIFSALSESGYGKTDCERAMLSIYGNPDYLLKSYKGMTPGAMPDFIGIMNSLPVVVDEITMANAEHVGNLAYEVSIGQTKNRLTREGKQRDVRDPWNTIVQTSTNFSLWERLAAKGATNDAQWLRMLEFSMSANRFRLTSEEARGALDNLMENHGTAGRVYMQYVVKNREKIAMAVGAEMGRIERTPGFDNAERFWAAGVACVVVGLTIAKAVKLIEVDVNAVREWAIEQIKQGRAGLRQAAPGAVAHVRQMMGDLQKFTGITQTRSPDTDLDQRFLNNPQFPLIGRLIIDGERAGLWFTNRAIREWCSDHGVGYSQVIDAGRRAGLIEKEEQFDLGVGTIFHGQPVACYRFKTQE